MRIGKATGLLTVMVIVSSILLHASAARAASPCRPNPVYIPTIGGSGTGVSSPLWRQHMTDFNGDGCADLAIGVPGEDIDNNTEDDGGAVNILYGLTSGLSAAGNQIFDQGSPDSIAGAPETGDEFGSAVTVGDFNGDGYTDLAVGVPLEDIDNNTKDNGGAVNVIYGSASGLTAAGNQIFDQGSPDSIAGAPETGDGFGAALSAGDFNGDGYTDLAVGVPFEDIDNNTKKAGGAVNVIYGSAGGLSAAGNQIFDQGSPDSIAGAPEAADLFGSALAAGDFNNDGYADLAIGVPGEDIDNNTKDNGGAVNIIYGSAGGLTAAGNQIFDQGSPDSIAGAPEADDGFGSAVAAGDFNNDGYADLAIGVPGEDIDDNTKDNGGAVNIIYGSANGLTAAGNQIFDQGSPDSIAGAPEADDGFGSAVAAGDFNGDSFADLAIGVRGEDIDNNTKDDGGAVNIIYGSANGLTAAGNQIFDQGSPDSIAGAPEAGDKFGSALR